MAVSISNVRRLRQGNLREVIVDITGPASYSSGGETITLAQLQALAPEAFANLAALPSNLNAFLQFDAEGSTGGHALVLDRANLKFMYFNGTTQIAGAVNLSAITIRARITYQSSAAA